MKRQFLFPAMAASALAQQVAPNEAEKALRTQVERYCQLTIDKKFREVEKLVATDSRDDYYASKKPEVRSFEVSKVELLPDGKGALVVVKAKMVVMAMGKPQTFEFPSQMKWIQEEGEWRWSLEKATTVASPFGAMTGSAEKPASVAEMRGKAPDISQIMNSLSLSAGEVVISRAAPIQRVMVKNSLPGAVDLQVASNSAVGVTAKLEALTLAGPGEVALTISIQEGTRNLQGGTVEVVAAPLGKLLTLKVTVAGN